MQRAAAAKFGDVRVVRRPCLCSTYSDWDDDLALALGEAAAAVICNTRPSRPDAARHPEHPAAGRGRTASGEPLPRVRRRNPTGARLCAACSEWGDTPRTKRW